MPSCVCLPRDPKALSHPNSPLLKALLARMALRPTLSSLPTLSPTGVLATLHDADASARDFLTRHARPLRAAAEALRLAAVVAPAADAELRAEAAAAAVGLLAAYRDGANARPPRRALEALRALELLLEMRARRDSRGGVWRVWRTVFGVETGKVLLRAVMLAQRGGRLLTAGAEALPPVPDPPVCTCGMQGVPGADKVLVTNGPRSGRKILQLDPNAAATGGGSGDVLDPLFVTAYERRAAWLMRVFVPAGGCAACDPAAADAAERAAAAQAAAEARHAAWPAPRWGHVAAEVLYILRPLVHLLLIRRYGWRSWRAWGASLAVDAASRQLMARGDDPDALEERQRRMMILLLYLARSPVFEAVLLAALRRVERILRRVPLLGPTAGSVVDLVRAIQRYWFYTSAS